MSTYIKHSERTVRKGCRTCHRNDLYWGHDTSRDTHKYCSKCEVSGKWVMIERDGTLHACFANGNDQDPDTSDDTPQQAAAPSVPAAPAGNTAQVAELFGQLVSLMAPKVDKADVESIVDGKLGQLKNDVAENVHHIINAALTNLVMPTTVSVQRPELPDITISNAHKSLPLVLTDMSAGEHVMMVGPAGTGKSTIAEQCAEALGRPFYSISLSPQTAASQLLGYMNATGDYVRSLFREAFEHGGVFHFDEFDNGNPSILALINAALANGHMAFPDGMVKRHADFLAVASANTYGRGPDRKYVGRQAIDVATLDRFSVEHIDVDQTLEHTLCLATGLDATKVDKVLSYVRTLRDNAEQHKMSVVFSPRASVGMCRLMHAGRTVTDAIDVRVRRGMSDQDWHKVTAGAVTP